VVREIRFPANFIQEVVDRTEIEELVSRYVPLTRKGANLWGCCPFHSEKTPSFSVSPAKKMFFCFGCHAGGSVITFVQKAENIEFAAAVEMLAARAGLPLPEGSERGDREDGIGRKRVLEMNLEAARFFRACLFDPAIGGEGLRYFTEARGLSPAVIKHFGLGFAPSGFTALRDHMRKKGFRDDELVAGYLCARSKKNNGLYDIFRNRVIFPIIDTSGNIVGFGGRVMDGSEPKYLNTSDTPAFNKRRNLFALNYAKNVAAERMILCEGYMDVIALHAAGFDSAVATLGTAITPDQARIFARYTKKVIITYDSDAAGQNAADKAMRLLAEVGVEVRVLKLTGAKDPDEFIKKFGADRFRRALEDSRTGFEHKAVAILSRHDLTESAEKLRASEELCSIIAGYSSPVERELYLQFVADRLELPRDVLRNSVEQIIRRQSRERRAQESRQAQATIRHYGDTVNREAAQNPRAAAAESAVLGMLLIYPEHRDAVERGSIALSADDFITEFHRRVFDATMELHRSENGFAPELLGESFSPDEMGRIRQIEVERQQLTKNGVDAFGSAVGTLKSIRAEGQASGMGLAEHIAYLKQKKLHKGRNTTDEEGN